MLGGPWYFGVPWTLQEWGPSGPYHWSAQGDKISQFFGKIHLLIKITTSCGENCNNKMLGDLDTSGSLVHVGYMVVTPLAANLIFFVTTLEGHPLRRCLPQINSQPGKGGWGWKSYIFRPQANLWPFIIHAHPLAGQIKSAANHFWSTGGLGRSADIR